MNQPKTVGIRRAQLGISAWRKFSLLHTMDSRPIWLVLKNTCTPDFPTPPSIFCQTKKYQNHLQLHFWSHLSRMHNPKGACLAKKIAAVSYFLAFHCLSVMSGRLDITEGRRPTHFFTLDSWPSVPPGSTIDELVVVVVGRTLVAPGQTDGRTDRRGDRLRKKGGRLSMVGFFCL